MSYEKRVQRFGKLLANLDGEIDWDLCALSYCNGDSAGFFSEERREAVLDAGLLLGSDIGEVLQKRPAGRSLYIGAAVAELGPMMYEAIVLERQVRWVALRSKEMFELDRAMKTIDGSLPRPRTTAWKGKEFAPCDHIWMTSVLTDPAAFPALHNELYQRQGTPQAVKGGHPKAEREIAKSLIHEALVAAAHDTLLTTTDEELQVLGPAVAAAGGTLSAAQTGRLNGLVGDVVRLCQLTFPK